MDDKGFDNKAPARSNIVPVVALAVDEHEQFRRATADVVRAARRLHLGIEVSNGEDTVLLQRSLYTRLLLLDINMPGDGRNKGMPSNDSPRTLIVVILLSTYDPAQVARSAELWRDGVYTQGSADT